MPLAGRRIPGVASTGLRTLLEIRPRYIMGRSGWKGRVCMKENRGFSPARRRLLQRFLMLAGAASAAGLLAGLLRRLQAQQVPETIPLPADLPEGLSVAGAVIVYRDDTGGLRAYSSRCTHLGCRIDRILDGEAACPCHGSRFRADGTVARGPAVRPLEPATLEPDQATGGWIARVPV